MDEYGLGVTTALGFDQAVSTTRLLLKAQGFRILSEMPAPAALAQQAGRQHLFMIGKGWEEAAAAIAGWLDGVLAQAPA